MKGKKKLIFFSLLIWGVLFKVVLAQAVAVSPAKYLVTLAPGEIGNITLEIKNNQPINYAYNLLVLGVAQNEKGDFSFGNNLNEAENWVVPEIDYLSLASGEKKQVNFKINVPAQAYPGSYFLGLAVQERNLSEAAINLTGRVIVLLNLQVAGEAREVLQIVHWSNVLSGNLPASLPFSLVLKNQGNVDLPLQGKIMIYNWQNKEVGSQNVYLGNQLLPNSARNYQLTFNSKIVWSPWYSARVVVNYGRTNQLVEKTVWVNNFSGYWLGVILFLLVLLFIFGRLAIKKKK